MCFKDISGTSKLSQGCRGFTVEKYALRRVPYNTGSSHLLSTSYTAFNRRSSTQHAYMLPATHTQTGLYSYTARRQVSSYTALRRASSYTAFRRASSYTALRWASSYTALRWASSYTALRRSSSYKALRQVSSYTASRRAYIATQHADRFPAK